MTIRLIRHGRALAGVIVAAALIVLALLPPSVAQEAPRASAGAASLESIRAPLDRVETTFKLDHLSLRALIDLGRTVAPLREQARQRVGELEPRLAQAQARLQQLGPPPAKDAPPERLEIANERANLTTAIAELDAQVKQAKLLAVRADQLAARIAERRSATYTRELFAQSRSVLDLSFWVEVPGAFAADLAQIAEVLRTSWAQISDQASYGRLFGAAATLVALAGIAWLGLTLWRRRFVPAEPTTRLAQAGARLWAFFRAAVTAPLLLAVLFEVLEAFGLATAKSDELAWGLGLAVAVASFSRGVASGLFAPDAPSRRLFAGDGRVARVLHDHLVWAARILGAIVLLKVAHHVVPPPQATLVATSMVYVLVMIALMLHLLLALRESGQELDGGGFPGLWVRGLAWLFTITAVASIMMGHTRFADFMLERLVSTIAIIGALALLLDAADALFTEPFTDRSPRGRAIAANLGLPPRRIGLIGVLLSGAVRLTLLIAALVLVIGPLEITAGDLIDTVSGFSFAFTIGEITISFGAIVGAVVTFAVIVVITRAIQRWLESQLLPRTEVEPSLQHSIVTIFGYLGAIVALSFAFAELGIDLQKIALVAGALSVGIGFGLQSIVSNFVSGLILLTERPIRVGDMIVVKGEEGYVRRIRVRATEIETYERASVIIPNSELISGVVKNWTHANTMGRIIIKVGAAYASDPERVRDILLAVARDHPQVLETPPPRALLMAFGDNALEFELRCIVRNVEEGLLVRSDLNLAILARFRAAGIEMPFPQRDVHVIGSDSPAAPAQTG